MNSLFLHPKTFSFFRKISAASLCFFFAWTAVYGQDERTQLALAQQYMDNRAFDKAIPILKGLYENAPFDKNLYDQYLDALIETKNYPDAEALVQYMMKIRRGDPAMLVDLGRVYEASGEKKEAWKTFQQAIEQLNTNGFQTENLAEAFEKNNKDEYAVAVYEKARELNKNPYLYATQLSMLYTKLGNTKKAIQTTLDLAMTQQDILDDVKAALAKIADRDKKGFSMIQKELENRLKVQPHNPFWMELFSWLFLQKGDYEGAYKQLVNLDKALGEYGQRLVPFAQEALKDKQYAIALKSYDYLLQVGEKSPYYTMASMGKVNVLLTAFENNWPESKAQLPELLSAFKTFFDRFPAYRSNDLWRHYAMVEARYNHRADTAIVMLQEAVNIPGAAADFIGRCKLDMGDYDVLQGKVWDATLIYAQVDKAFKEDFLGEQARFKNAKLAYYRGDFSWAQGQLSVLKASTTKLIANDALYLSILITENIPPDSNVTPLRRFAAADLLLFQHKTKESDQLLDSISKAFPQTPLQDDIDMLRAEIAMEEGRWQDAVSFLEDILEKYGDDVLGDDAAYKLAGIYRDHLKDKEKAVHYLELLITTYPGSTYIQEARKQYARLNK